MKVKGSKFQRGKKPEDLTATEAMMEYRENIRNIRSMAILREIMEMDESDWPFVMALTTYNCTKIVQRLNHYLLCPRIDLSLWSLGLLRAYLTKLTGERS